MLQRSAMVGLAVILAEILVIPSLASAAKPNWGTAGEEKPSPPQSFEPPIDPARSATPAQRGKPPTPGKPSWGESPARRILPPAPGPGPAGTAVLKLFWHGERTDYLTLATDAGAAEAQRAGYELVGWVGYVFTDAHAPCTAPLKLYQHPQKQDYATVMAGMSAPSPEESSLLRASYQLVRVEGHVLTLGTPDCVRNEAVKKQLSALAGGRPIVDLKLFSRGNDYLTTSDSFRGRMDPEHNLRSFRLVTTAGAVYGFPPAPITAAPGLMRPQASGVNSGNKLNIPGETLEQIAQRPATYGPIGVCDMAPHSRSSSGGDSNCVRRTGINVAAGSLVELTATGKVNFGSTFTTNVVDTTPTLDADGDHWQAPSDYPAPNLRKNSLIAKVGTTYHQGGTQRSFKTTEPGELILLANDGDMADNFGIPDTATGARGWQVQVKVTPPQPTGGGSGGTAPQRSSSHGPFGVCANESPRDALQSCVQRTGVRVRAGSRVDISATGKIDLGGAFLGAGAPVLDADGDHWPTPADYPAPGLRKNSLVVRIGTKYYQGGIQKSFVVAEEGDLVLLPNDKDLNDNTGVADAATKQRGWQVTVIVTEPAAR